MYWSPAVIAGIAGGAILLLFIITGILWYYGFHRKALSNRNSDTGSSDPSTLVEWNRGGRVSSAGGARASQSQFPVRQFTLQELEQATKNFSNLNLVGTGSFGLVYKGLLLDGTVVAIKKRECPARQGFVEEVRKLCEIWHRNLVTLIGYCQEGGFQMLVYEYLPNGSICSHLYDSKDSVTRLEFKQRLAIAIGAAKGLAHLHGLVPPLVHKGFKTNNVLVDENFIAKVADCGIVKLIQNSDDAGPSCRTTPSICVYVDPEVNSVGQLSESSDVYSFGVFLLELISGQEASFFVSPAPESSLAHLVEASFDSNQLIDPRLGTSYRSGGIEEYIGLILYCLNPNSRRRPKMDSIAVELDKILETEMSLTTLMGDGTAIVTLGSQLFTA